MAQVVFKTEKLRAHLDMSDLDSEVAASHTDGAGNEFNSKNMFSESKSLRDLLFEVQTETSIMSPNSTPADFVNEAISGREMPEMENSRITHLLYNVWNRLSVQQNLGVTMGLQPRPYPITGQQIGDCFRGSLAILKFNSEQIARNVTIAEGLLANGTLPSRSQIEGAIIAGELTFSDERKKS